MRAHSSAQLSSASRHRPALGLPCHDSVKRTICLAMIACLFSCGSAATDSVAPAACGPFGDPSAAVLSEVKPNCGQGKLIGPWKDADRVDRYACLYEPKSTGANRKLPMIVYLHPSLFWPDGLLRPICLTSRIPSHSATIRKMSDTSCWLLRDAKRRTTTHFRTTRGLDGIIGIAS